jgi:hypothetical protein
LEQRPASKAVIGHIDTVGATHQADIRRMVAVTLCL